MRHLTPQTSAISPSPLTISLCAQDESTVEDGAAWSPAEAEPGDDMGREVHQLVQATDSEYVEISSRPQQVWQVGVAGILGLALVGASVVMIRKLLSTQLPKVQAVRAPQLRRLEVIGRCVEAGSCELLCVSDR